MTFLQTGLVQPRCYFKGFLFYLYYIIAQASALYRLQRHGTEADLRLAELGLSQLGISGDDYLSGK